MNKKVKKNIIIIGSYILLTMVFIFGFIKSKHYLLMADSSFQLARANEIYQNLKQGGFFTFIATHCFSQSGVGTFLFYPSIFIYLLALLRFIFNPITAIWLWIGMFLFFTLVISFYSMLSFSKGNYKRSYIFAVLYTIVPYHLYLGLWNGTFGEFIAYTFLPLVFLGIYQILWLNSNNWYTLAIGMTLLSYSHILSLYISVGLCLVLFVLKIIFSSISKKQFFNLVKAAIGTFFLTLWQFIPFITDYLGKNIVAPNETFQFPYSFSDLVNNSFANVADTNGRMSIGIFLMLVMLVGWATSKLQHNKRELVIYILGTLITICSTTYLAWQSFGSNKLILHTLGNIQMTFRLLPYGSLFLAVTASYIIDNCSNLFSREKIPLLVMFILILIGGYYGSIQKEIQVLYNSTSKSFLNRPNIGKEKPVINMGVLVNKKDYNNIFDYQIIYGETDYYNKKAFKHSKSIINNWTYINNKKYSIKKLPGINKITMIIKNKKDAKVNLPIIAYHNTYVINNKKKIDYQISPRGTVEINLKKGSNKLVIGYKPSISYYILIIIAIICWIEIVKWDFKERGNKETEIPVSN